MKTRLDFSTLPIGTKVCCSIFGNGVVTDIKEQSNYPVGIRFNNGEKMYFTNTGRYIDVFPITLRLGHDRYKIGEPYPDFDYVGEDEIKLGDWCFMWDEGMKIRLISKISYINDNGKYLDQRGFNWDNMAKIPADLLEQIKELTKLGQ